MTRFFSFLVAAIFLVSATVEIASFAIDHKSWFQENLSALRDRFDAWRHPEEQTRQALQACEAACPAPPQTDARRCEDIEELGKKILCHISLSKPDASCRKDCARKSKPSAPGYWFRQDSKGKMASAESAHWRLKVSTGRNPKLPDLQAVCAQLVDFLPIKGHSLFAC